VVAFCGRSGGPARARQCASLLVTTCGFRAQLRVLQDRPRRWDQSAIHGESVGRCVAERRATRESREISNKMIRFASAIASLSKRTWPSLDLRNACQTPEGTRFGHWEREVEYTNWIPRFGNGFARMVGRGRAIEIICGADDFDADTTELYGWINCSLPDAELDSFVEISRSVLFASAWRPSHGALRR